MTNPFNTERLINSHFFPLTKGGEGSGRYPAGSGVEYTPRLGMSMSEYHIPGGGSAYHFIITSVSKTGHKFEALMAIGGDKARAKAVGEAIANAKTQDERKQIISQAVADGVLYRGDPDVYTRRREGGYQRVGRSGRWQPTVTLGSDYTQELWD